MNGDGFGFGWYPEPSEGGRPGVFRSIEPAWHDLNLRELTEVTRSPLFFCHVRAAAGPPIEQTNCHPFRHENWLFMHNGTIAEFGRVKRDLVMAVAPELFPSIQGTTDSEILFHLALTLGLQQDPISHATGHRNCGDCRAVPWCPIPLAGHGGGVRRGNDLGVPLLDPGPHQVLFHSADIGTLRQMYPDVERLHLFSDEAHVVVSEPTTDLPGSFIEVPEASLVVLDDSGYHQQAFNPSAVG